MNKEEAEQLEDLFPMPGWRLLINQTEEALELLNDLNGVNSLEELHLRKGRIQQLTDLLRLEEDIKGFLRGKDTPRF